MTSELDMIFHRVHMFEAEVGRELKAAGERIVAVVAEGGAMSTDALRRAVLEELAVACFRLEAKYLALALANAERGD